MSWLVKYAEHTGEVLAILNGLDANEAASAKIVSSTGYRNPLQQQMRQEVPPNVLMPMPQGWDNPVQNIQNIHTDFYVFYQKHE